MTEFRLLETMHVEDGRVWLLDRHLDRLSRSAAYFSFVCNSPDIRQAIMNAAPRGGNPSRLRLLLSRAGEYELDAGPMPQENPRRLRLSSVRVDSKNPFLYHKTTNRGVYDEARREFDLQTDVLLANERGEITETTIANIAVRRGGRWVTPLVSCGLLAGVMRAELLSAGEIVEGVVHASGLAGGESVLCFNALRGKFDVPLVSA